MLRDLLEKMEILKSDYTIVENIAATFKRQHEDMVDKAGQVRKIMTPEWRIDLRWMVSFSKNIPYNIEDKMRELRADIEVAKRGLKRDVVGSSAFL